MIVITPIMIFKMDEISDESKLTKLADINAKYFGIDPLILMENAGKAIALQCMEYNKILIFSGVGNNGGDGFCAARHLLAAGKNVKVYSINGNRTKENEKNFRILQNFIDIEIIKDSRELEKIELEIKKFLPDAVIDALLGTGARGELRDPIKSIVGMLNRIKAFKIAADIPTGDDKTKFKADKVISFHIKKTPDALTADIGIPKKMDELCGPGDVFYALKEQDKNAHKGYFGTVLVIGGSRNYIGAPYLTAKSAQNIVDLVYLMTPLFVQERISDPTLIFAPCNSKDYLSKKDLEEINIEKFDSIVIGNGMSLKADKNLIKTIINSGKKIVLDADALKLINPSDLNEKCIVTPHIKEFEALFKKDLINETHENKIKTVEKYAKEYNTTIVLKGRIDIISNNKRTKQNRTGNIRMTIGGTGDTLAGLIGGFSAQTDCFSAACAGTFINGLSGDLAYKENLCFNADDLIHKIPDAMRQCREYWV